jgi:ParB family chromosome partitioning protein
MTRKTGLGKGLDALIPASDSAVPESGIDVLLVSQISANPRQPRTIFNPDELRELAHSIREHGVIQPLVVAKAEQPNQYLLIAGERRLQAARLAGLAKVPVIIRDVTDQEFLLLALVENVQRADLSPLEAAGAYKHLLDEFNLTQEQVAKRVGKSRVAVTNTLSLLDLSNAVKQALAEGIISEGHARALKGLSHQSQSAALKTVVQKELNVRQTEELARKLKGDRPPQKPKPPVDPGIQEIESRLRDKLGTKVNLKHGQKGGYINIFYYSAEELNALVNKLLKSGN